MMPYVLGYGLSIVIALPVTYFLAKLLYKIIHSMYTCEQRDVERTSWIPITIGTAERVLITTLVAWSVPGAAAFIGTWLIVKVSTVWSDWTRTTPFGRATFSVRLLGSTVSILFAIMGGIVIKHY